MTSRSRSDPNYITTHAKTDFCVCNSNIRLRSYHINNNIAYYNIIVLYCEREINAWCRWTVRLLRDYYFFKRRDLNNTIEHTILYVRWNMKNNIWKHAIYREYLNKTYNARVYLLEFSYTRSLQKVNGLYGKSINLFFLQVETFSPYCY